MARAASRAIGAGTVALDEDLNRELVTWKVPSNRFTAKHQVTLREVLSHSAGFSVRGFPGYPRSGPIPTLRQVPAKRQKEKSFLIDSPLPAT